MILSHKDHELLNDYLEVVKEKENVLWEGKMQHIEEFNDYFPKDYGWLLIAAGVAAIYLVMEVYFLGLLILAGIAFFLSLSFIIKTINKHYAATQNDYRSQKAEHTQYLITNKNIVFILWQKGQFHIHSVSLKNIQKIIVNSQDEVQGNIFIIPREPVNFKTYNYLNDKPSQYITMFNIPNPKQVEAILQKHL